MNDHAKSLTSRRVLLALLLTLATNLHAEPRTSTNYILPTEITDAGGARATSAAYTNIGSLGGIAGLSTVAAPAETVKAGYIGQLYEVIALQLAATPATVDEGLTTQVSAVQVLDDDSLVALTADEIAWSVLAGPLTGIDTDGLATAAILYQDTSATAQASFAGNTGTLPLTVNNTNNDDFGSYAGDGLADDWQVLYFGTENPLAAPSIDADGDGQDNRFEFIAGVIPNDALSRFLWLVEQDPDTPGQNRIVFSPRLAERSYNLKTNTTLQAPDWIPFTGGSVSDEGDERTVTDPDTSDASKFYRLEISQP